MTTESLRHPYRAESSPWLTHLPTLVWAAALASVLLVPSAFARRIAPEILALSNYWADIAVHVVGLLAMGWLVGRSMTAVARGWAALLAIPLAALLGVVLEAGQLVIAGRSFELLDLATNGIAGAVGAALCLVGFLRSRIGAVDDRLTA